MDRRSRLIDGAIAARVPLLVVALAAAAALWPASRQLSFDRSIENMFARDDPVLGPFRRLQRTFGGQEIALAAYTDPALMSPEGLARLEALATRLGETPGVLGSFSLASWPGARASQWPVVGSLVGRVALPESVLELCEGFVLGPDRQTAAVVVVLDPDAPRRAVDRVPRGQTIDALRTIIETHDPPGVLTGEPVMIRDGFLYLERDGRVLGAVSTVLLGLVIVVSFRSLRWVVAPLVVVAVTLVVTQGLLVVGGFRLTMVSSMLWAIVTVIGVATLVHVILGFREHRADGLAPRAALARTLDELAAPVTWACLTDAVGFGALLVSRVGPVHDFGRMMVLGSLVTLAAIGLLTPGLVLIGPQGRAAPRPERATRLQHALRGLALVVERHPGPLAAVLVALTALTVPGLAWLDVETDFTRNFRAASPVVASYNFVETKLGGAGMLDCLIPVPEGPEAAASPGGAGGADVGWLPRVARLQERLRREVVTTDAAGHDAPALTKVVSVVDLVEALKPAWIPMPRDPRTLAAVIAPLGERMPLFGSLYGRDPVDGRTYLRIMLRAHERQSSTDKARIIAQVEQLVREEFPEAEVSGLFVLLARLIESLSRDQWLSFGLATLGIGLMLGVATRSVRLALIGLLPNALPVLMITGLMGWSGTKINLGGAMIASVSMGLAVDSSLHYLLAFQRRRRSGRNVHEALHDVQQHVGRAMVLSTLALVVGFSALAFSEFVPTVSFGILVGLTMIGGLLGNLIILPLALVLVAPRDPHPPRP